MKATIGLGVSRDRVRAVLVEKGVVEWATEAKIEAIGGTEGAIRALLDQAPLDRRSRTPVRVALGPWLAQVKALGSLPGELDAETLDRLVSENPGTFFIRNGVPLVTTNVRKRGDSQFAAALHAPLVDTLKRVARERGVRLEAIVPSGETILAATSADRASWSDGDLSLDVERGPDGAPNVTAVFRRETPAAPLDPLPGLATIGDRAPAFADAFGAAVLPLEDALVYYPTDRRGNRRSASRRPWRWHLVLTAALCGVALLAPLGAFVRATRSEAQLESLRGDSWQRVISTRAQLERVTARLERLRILGSHPTVTVLLADLGAGLPDGAAITALTTVDGEATIEVVASNAAAVVFALQSRSSIELARFAGSIERVQLAGRSMERATIVLELAELATAETVP